MDKDLIIIFPDNKNGNLLYEAVTKALGDEDFMGDNKKVNKAVEALTPKDTLTATLKRLQGNANRDYLDKKDQGIIGYTEETRSEKIKEYVTARFQAYMDNPKTSGKATKLYNDTYPVKLTVSAPEEPTDE